VYIFLKIAHNLIYFRFMNEEHDKDAPEDKELPSDVSFEPEEDLGDIGAAQAKLKKLKDELGKVKKERQDYLDGWQRCKADAINMKKDAVSSAARSAEMLREALVHDIIPVLDSFDMAAGSEQWNAVEPGWRSGMEQVRNQLVGALEGHGIKRYGKIGDMFDPALHEIVQEESEMPGEVHSIVRVIRFGYKSGDRVLRPAQVVIKV